MRLWVVIVLTLVALATGAGVGFVSSFFTTVFSRIAVDVELACVLLQKTEAAGFITKDQRVRLVDIVLPEVKKSEPEREAHASSRAPEWFERGDRWRTHMKSGCPDA